jgi:DnaJ-class molecular chaperone
MSKQSHVIEIAPEAFGASVEYYYFSNYKCQQCGGTGLQLKFPEDKNGRFESCKLCDGTGKVKAKVEISWMPDRD